MCFFRLAHSESSFSGGTSQSVNNPDLVEDLSQVQQLQNESSNTAENTEQKPEEEVRWNNSDFLNEEKLWSFVIIFCLAYSDSFG